MKTPYWHNRVNLCIVHAADGSIVAHAKDRQTAESIINMRETLKAIVRSAGTQDTAHIEDVNGINDGKDRAIRYAACVEMARKALEQ